MGQIEFRTKFQELRLSILGNQEILDKSINQSIIYILILKHNK